MMQAAPPQAGAYLFDLMGAPFIVLGVALLALVLDLVLPRRWKVVTGLVSSLGVGIAAMWAARPLWPLIMQSVRSLGPLTSVLVGTGQTYFSGMVKVDMMAAFVNFVITIVAFLVCLGSVDSLAKSKRQGEFYVLVLLAAFGAMIMASATDLIMLYVGLEAATLPAFVLVGLRKYRARSTEGALKYLLLGLFSSAVLLYGLTLVYAISANTGLENIAVQVQQQGVKSPLLLLGVMMALVGFGFKIAAFPFHWWAPDAYEGGQGQAIAFISTVPKIAALAAMVRFYYHTFPALTPKWAVIITGLAVASMTFGNLVALSQRNIKRMLAYSGVAHAGYALIGLAMLAPGPGANQGNAGFAIGTMFLYLFVYSLANAGAFLVVAAYSDVTGKELVEDYAGLGRRQPMLALALTVFLLSLAGIPPLAGFMGKFSLFLLAVSFGKGWLAIVALLNSVISLGYYGAVIRQMYMVPVSTAEADAEGGEGAGESGGTGGVPASLKTAIALAALAVVAIGIYPGPFILIVSGIH